MKRILTTCAAVLLLAAAYTIGASRATGQGAIFKVVGTNAVIVGETAYYLEISNAPYGWREMPYDIKDLPPVPVSSIASYSLGQVITDSGEAWLRGVSGWTSYGYPGALQPAMRTTLGSVKARYR